MSKHKPPKPMCPRCGEYMVTKSILGEFFCTVCYYEWMEHDLVIKPEED